VLAWRRGEEMREESTNRERDCVIWGWLGGEEERKAGKL
jgi:hypothetical protein